MADGRSGDEEANGTGRAEKRRRSDRPRGAHRLERRPVLAV